MTAPADVAASLGMAFLGTFVWIFNCEALLVVQVAQRGWHALPAALLMTVGQAAAWTVLFAAGRGSRARWAWFDRRCAEAQARWGHRLQTGAWWVMVASGVLGAPPTSAVAVLAPGLDIRLFRLLPLLFASRLLRFFVIGALAARFIRFHFVT